jgi:hypothetical protein
MRLIQDDRLVDDKVKSATDGSFALRPLPPSRYTIRPTHADCTVEPIVADLRAFETKDLGPVRCRRE